MRFLFVSAQLPGHLDWGGYLATAVELQRRGHTVLWASREAVRPLLDEAGLPLHALPETGWRWPPPPPLSPQPDMDPAAWQQLRVARALDQWLEVARVEQAVLALQDAVGAFAPHVLVGEMFVAAAGIVAETMDVPFVVVGWPAVQSDVPSAANQPVVDRARQRLQSLLNRFDVCGVNWTMEGPPALCSPHLHVSYWSPRWFAGVPLQAQTQHVGGRAAPPTGTAIDVELPEDAPLVFITLGTTFADDPNFFLAAAHATVQAGARPLLALGGLRDPAKVRALRKQLPVSAIVRQRVDFAAVLPHVAAAIHHGGAGTTHALVTHAVPQIIVPHAGDQMRQAQGVMRSGVGVHIPARQVTIAKLAETLRAFLPADAPIRPQTRALRAEFAALGGVARAADLLLDVPPSAGRSPDGEE